MEYKLKDGVDFKLVNKKSKIVILLIMYMNHLIIKNYTRLYEEGEE